MGQKGDQGPALDTSYQNVSNNKLLSKNQVKRVLV